MSSNQWLSDDFVGYDTGGVNWAEIEGEDGLVWPGTSGSHRNWRKSTVSYGSADFGSEPKVVLEVQFKVSDLPQSNEGANRYAFGLEGTDSDIVYKIAPSNFHDGSGQGFFTRNSTGNTQRDAIDPPLGEIVTSRLELTSSGAELYYNDSLVASRGSDYGFDFNKDYEIYEGAQGDRTWTEKEMHSLTLEAIPEPATFGLLGLFGIVALLRRKLMKK